jgi:hypothetical protein
MKDKRIGEINALIDEARTLAGDLIEEEAGTKQERSTLLLLQSVLSRGNTLTGYLREDA